MQSIGKKCGGLFFDDEAYGSNVPAPIAIKRSSVSCIYSGKSSIKRKVNTDFSPHGLKTDFWNTHSDIRVSNVKNRLFNISLYMLEYNILHICYLIYTNISKNKLFLGEYAGTRNVYLAPLNLIG
jgi:hypothetical protein